MKSILFAVSATALAFSTPAFADWSTTVQSLGIVAPAQTGSVDCPPGGSGGLIWGSGTYTSDSAICMAAVHWGWITQAQGGGVTFQTVPGMDAYAAEDRNGISSSSYGPWDLSFQITGLVTTAAPPPPGQAVIRWTDSLDSIASDAAPGDLVPLICAPQADAGGTVWGSDVYTSDSAICMAARHRGVLSTEGGQVTILVLGSQPAFLGSDRNGVSSQPYPEWGSSYIFQ